MSDERMRELTELVGLFFPDMSSLGEFVRVDADSLPRAAWQLLAHNSHMTPTLEAYHQSPVRVEVLSTGAGGDRYWRQILLRRKRDDRVVQYAIVRIDFRHIDAQIRREIEEQGAPLGRILIDHDVLRNVVLLSLWRIEPAAVLRQRLDLPEAATIFGRTALIFCNDEPAIELLEIPTPA